MPRIALIGFIALAFVVPRMDGDTGAPAPIHKSPPVRYDFPKSSWPEFVTVRIPVVVRVWEQGKDVGTVGLEKGVRLKVINLDKHGILDVEFAGARCFIDHAATDFMKRLK